LPPCPSSDLCLKWGDFVSDAVVLDSKSHRYSHSTASEDPQRLVIKSPSEGKLA
jgi:hypothetical protein